MKEMGSRSFFAKGDLGLSWNNVLNQSKHGKNHLHTERPFVCFPDLPAVSADHCAAADTGGFIPFQHHKLPVVESPLINAIISTLNNGLIILETQNRGVVIVKWIVNLFVFTRRLYRYYGNVSALIPQNEIKPVNGFNVRGWDAVGLSEPHLVSFHSDVGNCFRLIPLCVKTFRLTLDL